MQHDPRLPAPDDRTTGREPELSGARDGLWNPDVPGDSMTEDEWRNCTQPSRMTRHLGMPEAPGNERHSWFGPGTLPREWRCFLAASCRRVVPRLGNRAVQLVEFACGIAESAPTAEDVRQVLGWFGNDRISNDDSRLIGALTWPPENAVRYLRSIVGGQARRATKVKAQKQAADRAAMEAEAAAQCDLIRDIFGNPFFPVEFEEAWRSAPAVDLASAMYSSQDFTRMPDLGTALADAGCVSTEVLAHCRTGTHVRGCWVVDGVLCRR